MIILKVESRKSFFCINDKEVSPEEISKHELLDLLHIVFENHNIIEMPREEDLDSIANPIEKEIVIQIKKKICELLDNVTNITEEIESKFPNFD